MVTFARGKRKCEYCNKEFSWWGKVRQDIKYGIISAEIEITGIREANIERIDGKTIQVKTNCTNCGREQTFKEKG